MIKLNPTDAMAQHFQDERDNTETEKTGTTSKGVLFISLFLSSHITNRQAEQQCVEISYTQVRVCLFLEDKEVTEEPECVEPTHRGSEAAQRVIMCHTTSPQLFCVYNYAEENGIPLQTKQKQQLHLCLGV